MPFKAWISPVNISKFEEETKVSVSFLWNLCLIKHNQREHTRIFLYTYIYLAFGVSCHLNIIDKNSGPWVNKSVIWRFHVQIFHVDVITIFFSLRRIHRLLFRYLHHQHHNTLIVTITTRRASTSELHTFRFKFGNRSIFNVIYCLLP